MKQRLANVRGRPNKVPHILSEAFSKTGYDTAAIAFALSRLPRTGAPILRVQDRLSRKEAGHPSLAGLGIKRSIILVNLSRPVDVLWTMEDGLRCKALGGVIGEIWGNPNALDFTATKRLALRAESGGLPCWLIRHSASPDLSAARERWRAHSMPSGVHPHDVQAPGDPRWALELFRSRRTSPGTWVATHDRAADCINLATAIGHGEVDAGHGASRQRATG